MPVYLQHAHGALVSADHPLSFGPCQAQDGPRVEPAPLRPANPTFCQLSTSSPCKSSLNATIHPLGTPPAWIPYLGQFLPSCSGIGLSPVLASEAVYKG